MRLFATIHKQSVVYLKTMRSRHLMVNLLQE